MTELIPIPEFYANKTIFITGGSGFIGKVLIEKLLRSCPDFKTIYLLMRPKKGKTPEERIKDITDLPLFDLVRKSNPENFSKLQLIPGDSSELNLGLNPSDRQRLIQETDIIFHGAASVRFDDPLDEAVILNTRGTRELALLALEMQHLQVLVHISTTYCNTDRQVIGEELYPPLADWRKTIEIAERADRSTINIFTKKYIEPMPNTYTFAKQLAEHVVCDLCVGKVPVIIFRPSIVISSVHEPFPGWIDNFNGPVGLMVASGKGIVRSVYANPNLIADYVPVDLVAKALLISAWKKGQEKDFTATIYNGSNNRINPTTIKDIVELGDEFLAKTALNNVFWYPNGSVTFCHKYHLLKVFFYQLLPALLVDGILKLAGQKPLLVKIQRKIYVASSALKHFLEHEWTFINTNAVNLEKALLPIDDKDFGYHTEHVDQLEYFINASIGTRRYLLKEDDASMEQAKIHANRMWVISKIFNTVWYLAVLWILWKIDTIGFLINRWNGFCQYWDEL